MTPTDIQPKIWAMLEGHDRARTDPWRVTRGADTATVTVSDLIQFCSDNDLDPAKIKCVGQVHLRWDDVETEVERDERVAQHLAWRARHEAWERGQLVELIAKYGVPTSEAS